MACQDPELMVAKLAARSHDGYDALSALACGITFPGPDWTDTCMGRMQASACYSCNVQQAAVGQIACFFACAVRHC